MRRRSSNANVREATRQFRYLNFEGNPESTHRLNPRCGPTLNSRPSPLTRSGRRSRGEGACVQRAARITAPPRNGIATVFCCQGSSIFYYARHPRHGELRP
jgi:hypothetical protein